ncbi:M57 family metalloprotease [uncultured Winogradskyella sp.]|uniref:M57 family metalloprotease n=1 Tax=uncultured Winogradskyella sp. TaxID=395353 RepID=UPI002613ECC8|nr:M57 family metalloprotease [uncultured Winogradskyella sp.]
MKSLINRWAVTVAAFALVFMACQKEETNQDDNQSLNDIINVNSLEGKTLITDQKFLEDIRSLDIDAGAVSKGDFHFPDGSVEERIYIGSDIVFANEDLRELIQQHKDGAKQYRTFNLVTGANRTIDIIGFTGGSQALTSKARSALEMAVANFNNLNTSLQFNLSFGTDYQQRDIVVYDNSVNNPNGSGGQAGFPSSAGEPFKFVQIYGIDGFSTDVNEHIITHELGHSIGFRHSDWFDRLSCPVEIQGNEGTGSDGAVHIPGTPTDRDLTSVMQACADGGVTGEFNSNDITALEYMYPTSNTGGGGDNGGDNGPCDGVPQFQRGVNYSVGDRVVYFGNLYERQSRRWRFIGSCN